MHWINFYAGNTVCLILELFLHVTEPSLMIVCEKVRKELIRGEIKEREACSLGCLISHSI